MKKILATTALAVMLGISSMAMAGNHEDHKIKMEAALAKLPDEKAALVKRHFKEMRAEHRANRESYEKHRDEMKALLTASKFDKQAFVAKAKELASKHSSLKVKGAERLADLASKLNQEERKVLADILPKHGHKKGHKKD